MKKDSENIFSKLFPAFLQNFAGEILSNAGRTGLVGFLPTPPPSLSKAASQITGLSMEHAEALQV